MSLVLACAQTYFFVLSGTWLWVNLGVWTWDNAYALYGMPTALYYRLPTTILIYWLILAVVYALDYQRESRLRAQRALKLQDQLSRSRLDALESQLQPHFLFNALHSILSLIDEQRNEQAKSMVVSLSDLLRHRLDQSKGHEVTLRQEMTHIDRYLNMISVRYNDRLDLDIQISNDTLDAYVPTFILQPLAENAIRHGVEKHAGEHRLQITSEVHDGQLRIRVRNTKGATESSSVHLHSGLGLQNTRDRLDTLYPNHGSYVSQMTQEITRSRQEGFLLREDAATQRRAAAASEVGQ